jgi:hypothetical protein
MLILINLLSTVSTSIKWTIKTKNFFGNRALSETDCDDSDENEDSTETVRQIERERSLSPSSNDLINQRPITPAMSQVSIDSDDRSAAGTPFISGTERTECLALDSIGYPCTFSAVLNTSYCREHSFYSIKSS